MRRFLCLLLAVAAAAGCVSRKKERGRERDAYMAGQQQAMQAAAQARREQQGPAVFVQGQVQNTVVPWEEGMTLSQAIVKAVYTGFMNPRLIRVMRNGQVAGELKGIDLLHREDMDVQDGDTILILP